MYRKNEEGGPKRLEVEKKKGPTQEKGPVAESRPKS